jgi:hypothetical protein
MTHQPSRSRSVAAVVVTAAALVTGGLGASPSAAETAAPFSCALLARQDGGSVVLEGQVTAHDAVSGTYELRVRGSGVSIDQGGGISVGAGQSVRLGEATISGRASDYDASLTITIGGQAYVCQLQEI